MIRNNCNIQKVICLLCLILCVGCQSDIPKEVPPPKVDPPKESPLDTSTNNNTLNNMPSPAASANPTPASSPSPSTKPTPTYQPILLGFAGDINLDDNNQIMKHYSASKQDIRDFISNDLILEMKNVDIMMLNNEFPYSKRGTKAAGKDYTFRSEPKNVNILKEWGVDIVSLANNHTLDFGREALEDTFTVLDREGIDYVGAGSDDKRAGKVIVYEQNGKKIGYIAASRVLYQPDWKAAPNRSGMMSAYDKDALVRVIKKSKKECDYLIIYLHWGVEYNSKPEDYQREWAKAYIDAGADAVIGCHPHVIQGIEFYQGKPILYSLGNYWFNSATKDSIMVKLILREDGSFGVEVVPCFNQSCKTYIINGKNARRSYFKRLEQISFGVSIDKNGKVTENN